MARCGCISVCNCLITALDTDCINMTVAGAGTAANPYVISAEPVISPDANNTLECRGNGLFAAGATVVALDTDSIDMTVVEAPDNTFTVSGDVLIVDDGQPILDGQPNLLKLMPGQGPNGLYVSCEDVQDCVGSMVFPNLAGTCLEYDDGTDRLNVMICEDPANTLVCVQPGANPLCPDGGLFVAGAPTVINVVDLDPTQNQVVGPPDTITFTCVPIPITANTAQPGPGCIGVTGDSCNGFNITLGISDDPDQCLQCRGDGLFVCCPRSQIGTAAAPATMNNVNGTFNGLVLSQDACVTITNPSTCYSMIVRGKFRSLVTVQAAEPTESITVRIFANVNGGPFGPTGGASGIGGFPDVAGRNFAMDAILYDDGFFSNIGPGGNVQYCIRTVADGVNVTDGFIQTQLSILMEGVSFS